MAYNMCSIHDGVYEGDGNRNIGDVVVEGGHDNVDNGYEDDNFEG